MATPQQPLPTAPESPATPSQLAGVTLPQSLPEVTGALGAKEPSSATPKVESQQFSSFISMVHSYLWSAVMFADQNAAFLFASSSAFLGYLLSIGVLHQLKPPVTAWRVLQWLSFASLLFLVSSIAMAIYVVMPRLGGKRTGLIYFGAIANRKNKEQYVAEVLSSTDSSIGIALAEHSYEVATIATRKYKHLQIGIWVGAAGFLSGLAYIGLCQ